MPNFTVPRRVEVASNPDEHKMSDIFDVHSVLMLLLYKKDLVSIFSFQDNSTLLVRLLPVFSVPPLPPSGPCIFEEKYKEDTPQKPIASGAECNVEGEPTVPEANGSARRRPCA